MLYQKYASQMLYLSAQILDLFKKQLNNAPRELIQKYISNYTQTICSVNGEQINKYNFLRNRTDYYHIISFFNIQNTKLDIRTTSL